jgi:hypothetical protein
MYQLPEPSVYAWVTYAFYSVVQTLRDANQIRSSLVIHPKWAPPSLVADKESLSLGNSAWLSPFHFFPFSFRNVFLQCARNDVTFAPYV